MIYIPEILLLEKHKIFQILIFIFKTFKSSSTENNYN